MRLLPATRGLGRLRSGDLRWRLRLLHGRLLGRPRVGHVDLGSLRRVTPVSRAFGFDRGRPIDRYYIERFLERHADAIHGRVLEVGDAHYTRRFGDPARLVGVDVLDIDPSNPDATLIADLTTGRDLPSDAFDCIICTQVLHYVYDLHAAVHTLHRLLNPGGALLVTVPGVSRVSGPPNGDFWRFTSASTRRLLEEVFDRADVMVDAHGNVLAATAFLHGLGAEELEAAELDFRDSRYEVLIALKAVKRGGRGRA